MKRKMLLMESHFPWKLLQVLPYGANKAGFNFYLRLTFYDH
jgi:hypothetical protein